MFDEAVHALFEMSDFDSSSPNLKFVLVGQSMVGKTSIANVIQNGEFVPDQRSTIGACFQIKQLELKKGKINVHVWDTAGQERFKALTPMYYRDAQIVLLVYAIDNRDSFSEVETWYQGLVADCFPMPLVVIVANKADLVGVVPEEEGRQLAERLNGLFYQVSAKCDPQKVNDMFVEVTEKYVTDENNVFVEDTGHVVVSAKKSHKKRCCA